jgi:glucose/arabinose dehydrogenase
MKSAAAVLCVLLWQAADRTAARLDHIVHLPREPLASSAPAPTRPVVLQTSAGDVRVVPIARGLRSAWSFSVLPDGDVLVTERAGRIRIVHDGALDPWPLAGFPSATIGPSGLLDIVLHPDFDRNHLVYWSYAKLGIRGQTLAIGRARLDGRRLVDAADVFVAEAFGPGFGALAGRLTFGPGRTLYVTIGDREVPDDAQNLASDAGKILRLRDDGSIPPDNPFASKAHVRREIFSYGHRNPYGLAFDSATGMLWSSDHGPRGGDELNVILPGGNYGWPRISSGRAYTGEAIGDASPSMDAEPPVMTWTPAVAPSSLFVYDGSAFPRWKGNIFVGTLAGMALHRLEIGTEGPVRREALLSELRLRLRAATVGPDGLIYVMTDGPHATILRIEPAHPAW